MSFWAVHTHPILYLLVLLFFPRLTLFINFALGGFLSTGFFWWAGWAVAPQVLIAVLASSTYWDTNPLLVIVAWVWALLAQLFSSKVWRERHEIRSHSLQGFG